MNDNGGGWPIGWTLLLGGLGIVVAFALISGIAPWVFDCGEASAKECSEIVRNNGLAVAGVFAGLIGLLALHFNARRTHTDRLRLTNDTYVKAIEQLRSDSVEVRVGGMYALERIALEEQRYHWPVIETLSAYIRERAPWPAREKEAKGLDAVAAAIVSVGGTVAERLPAPEIVQAEPEEAGEQPEAKDATGAEAPRRAPTDIQTALTIIGQRSQQWRERAPNWLQQQAPKIAGRLRKWRERPLPRSEFAKRWGDAAIAQLERVRTEPTRLEPRRIDWRHTDLRHADLSGSDLRGANLRGADLTGADLTGADLTGANLTGADLTGAYLTGASLTGASLRRANLTGAYLMGAYLRGAYLMGAYLMGAYLMGAYLRGAYLMGAYLRGAYLMDANLMDANLTDAYLTGADLTDAYLTGAYLTGADLTGADLTGAQFSKHPQELGALWDEANPPMGLDSIEIVPTPD